MQSSVRWLRRLAASAFELLSSNRDPQNELTSWQNWFIWSISLDLIGSAGLIGLDLLINYTGSSNQTNQTNLLDEINQIRA
jgi:hypothetical protein